MIDGISARLAERGIKCAFTPISRVGDLRREITELGGGEVQTDFIKWWISIADRFLPDGLDFEPRSIITAIAYSPKVSLRFNYGGRQADCVLPPTYGEVSAAESRERRYISSVIGQSGCKFEYAGHIPQKLLAVHCGLGKYGRNNIFYGGDFGSYVKIYTYVSDIPCEDAGWLPIARMDACETCTECVAACPTGAIAADRKIINADICVTAFNERDGDFPDWLDKAAHNSLVGCVKCQDCCPLNAKHVGDIVRGAEFTESETMELLGCGPDKPVPGEIADKFKAVGLWENFIKHIPRNLAPLLENG